MSESANIAYSYVQHILNGDAAKTSSSRTRPSTSTFPSGATPKDGPSAGVTMASSIYSLVTGKIIRKGLAMTGELTLSGRVLPVGGVKEKVIAAKRAGIKSIILPGENKKDLAEIPEYIKKGMTFHFVNEIDEVIKLAFNK